MSQRNSKRSRTYRPSQPRRTGLRSHVGLPSRASKASMTWNFDSSLTGAPSMPTTKTIDAYDRDTARLLLTLQAYASMHFGDRCPDQHQDCACCILWKLIDEMKELIDV